MARTRAAASPGTGAAARNGIFSGQNWTGSPTGQFKFGDHALFTASAAEKNVVLDGDMTVSGMAVTGGSYTFSGGKLTARADSAEGSQVPGTGMVTVSGANTLATLKLETDLEKGISLESGGGIRVSHAKALSETLTVGGGGTSRLLVSPGLTVATAIGIQDASSGLHMDIGAGGTLGIDGLHGKGGVLVNGSGTALVTQGETRYGGDFFVETGTLRVDSGASLTGMKFFALNPQGTLAGGGALQSDEFILEGTVSPGNDGLGLLTLTGHTTLDGATLRPDLDENGVSGRLTVKGSLAQGAENTLDFASWLAGTYTVLSADSLSGPLRFKPTINGQTLNRRQEFAQAVKDNALTVTLHADNLDLTWTGEQSGTWDGHTENWTSRQGPMPFVDYDYVRFDAQASQKNVDLANRVTVAGMEVSGDYAFSGAELLGKNLEKPGGQTVTGRLAITGGTAAFSNTVRFENGMVVDKGATAKLLGKGSFNGMDIENHGTVVFATDSDYHHDKTVFGNGEAVARGAVTTTLANGALPLYTVEAGARMVVTNLFMDQRKVTVANSGDFRVDTLHVEGKGNELAGVHSLAGSTLAFYLPADVQAGDVMLKTTPLDVSGATLDLVTENELSALRLGDTVVLIDKTTGTIANQGDIIEASGALDYRFTLDKAMANRLAVRLAGMGANEKAKSYLESGAASLALLADNARFSMTQGMAAALGATPEAGFNAFAASSAADVRYNTGSHVDVKSFTVLGGITGRFNNSLGSTRVGVLAEGGHGTYDSHNSFPSGSVKGDGDIDHAGGGVFARHDFAFGTHLEASFRGGRVETKYSSSDIVTRSGSRASFTLEGAYYGGHLGIGQRFKPKEDLAVDVYSQVFWTRQEGGSARPNPGETLRLDAADSVSARFGVSATRELGRIMHVQARASWDYEFDGKQTGTLNGASIAAPTMRGGSGEFGLGLGVRPTESFSVNLEGFGVVGKREGIGGQMQFRFHF